MKNMVQALGLLSLFLLANVACAAVLLNEVQISPTENRFIELYNDGESSVDLTGWYLQRKTQSGSTWSSLVTSTNFEGKKIEPHGYFLISRSSMPGADMVLGNLTLTESNTLQLKNPNAEVVNKVCLSGATDCEFAKESPNPSENKSAGVVDGVFVETNPTPGTVNIQGVDNTNTEQQSSNTESEPSSTGVSIESKLRDISINLLEPDFIFTDYSAKFAAEVYGTNGEKLIYGKLIWNFGDGVSLETRVNEILPVAHTYFYPGEYVLSLEYYTNDYLPPNASLRKNINVINSTVLISSIGALDDFFIEISNPSKYDMDISGWKVAYGEQSFILPKHSILAKNQKIKLSPNITKFSYTENQLVVLYNANFDFVYSSDNLNKNKTQNTKLVNNTTTKKLISDNRDKKEADKDYVDLTGSSVDLTASTAPFISESPNTNRYILILMTVIGVGALVVYFIRKSTTYHNDGDFEIIDE